MWGVYSFIGVVLAIGAVTEMAWVYPVLGWSRRLREMPRARYLLYGLCLGALLMFLLAWSACDQG
jgi:hypothetical protein